MPRKRKEQSDNYYKAFPSAMRELMNQRNTTQNELADYLQKSRQAISYYCDGSSSPDWETIVKIADYFNVSTEYLLGRTKDKNRNPCAMDELGLSSQVVEWLKSLNHGSASNDTMSVDISNIMESITFQLLMYNLREYRKAIIAEVIYDRVWERFFPDDSVMYQDDALKQHDAFKNEINKIIKSGQYDGYITKYLEIISFLNTDGTDGPDVSKLADMLIGVEGFTPSELCSQRVNKYMTLLMEDLKADVINKDIAQCFEQAVVDGRIAINQNVAVENAGKRK